MGVARFERLFRVAAGLDVDKADPNVGPAHHQGLQERMYEFRGLDQDIELASTVAQIAGQPPLNAGVAHWERAIRSFNELM
jgi:hypothetical protein